MTETAAKAAETRAANEEKRRAQEERQKHIDNILIDACVSLLEGEPIPTEYQLMCVDILRQYRKEKHGRW